MMSWSWLNKLDKSLNIKKIKQIDLAKNLWVLKNTINNTVKLFKKYYNNNESI